MGVSSSPPPSSRLSHWHAEVNRVADGLFYRLGRQVALNPKKVVALGLFGTLVCCSGFTNFRVESAGKRGTEGRSLGCARRRTWYVVAVEHAR